MNPPYDPPKFPLGMTVLAAIGILPVVLIGGLLGVAAVVISGGGFDPKHPSITQALTVQLFAELPLVPYLLFVMRKLWKTTPADLGFRRPTWANAGTALLGALVMVLVVQGLATLIQTAAHSSHEQLPVELLKTIKARGVLVYFAVFAVVVAPFIEELTFRVFFFNAARRVSTFWVAAVFSGLLFGAAHADLIAFAPLTLGGMILCYLYSSTRNAYTSMITHALFNGTTIVALLAATHLPAAPVR